jgi:hypothetical protein
MKQDIIENAEACGFTRTHTGEVQLWLCNKNDLERLVKLVDDKATAREREAFAAHAVDIARRAVAQEREACAKVCEDISPKTEPVEYGDIRWGWKYKCPYAAAIRARGES